LQLGKGEFEGKRLVAAESLAETRSPQIPIVAGSIDYGMGWMLRSWRGHGVVEHGGNIDGFAASVAMLPEEGLGMVLLTNSSFTPLQGTAMNLVWEALLTDAYLPADAREGEDFSAFLGEYVSTLPGMKDNFQVLIKDGKLAVDVPGQTVYTLLPPDDDGWRYFEATDTVAVSFDENEAGEVIALRMHQGGMNFELLREGVVLPPQVDEADVRELLGGYESESGMSATVLISNGRLAVDIPGQMVYELDPPESSGDYHFHINYDFVVSFEPGKSMTIIQPGASNRFVRERRQAPALTLEQLHQKRKSAKRAKAFAKAGVLHFEQRAELINAGVSATGERWADPAGRLREAMEFGPLGTSLTVMTEEGAWSESSFEPSKRLKGVELAQLRQSLPHILFGDWREHYDSETYLRSESRDGRTLHVIELRKEGLPTTEIVVDGKSWDVVEVHGVQVVSNGLRLPLRVEFSDYRTVSGVRVPFVVKVTNQETGTTVVTTTKVEAKVAEDPARFVLPAG
ncbi:MAG: serine hydrolase, partial [Myxococcales bacterium]|nr:serine hydrolase [Myxococcales bacterium]